ncbi:hypothetical protein ABZ707_24210 [Streptomyces sp. NPDC006923]|uniref:hypothetical protein n=1 Tax=Streptomyces sp. NPDC006923 TaxID=3155355 RepID=UPI0033EE157F
MSASEREKRTESSASSRPPSPSALSMRDLLASCAAAAAVSTPPRTPSAVALAEAAGRAGERAEQRPDAA